VGKQNSGYLDSVSFGVFFTVPEIHGKKRGTRVSGKENTFASLIFLIKAR
jgi:hypothetical protein